MIFYDEQHETTYRAYRASDGALVRLERGLTFLPLYAILSLKQAIVSDSENWSWKSVYIRIAPKQRIEVVLGNWYPVVVNGSSVCDNTC